MEEMKIAIYARQSVPEEQGIAQQLKEARDGIDARKLTTYIVDEYPDNATSGTRERGPKSHWARMLADIDSGRINTVVCTAPDRLTRSLSDVLELRPPKRNVRVIAVRAGIDTDDSTGQLFLTMLVAQAEQEVRDKERRAIPYRASRRTDGHPTAGRVPFGYKWIPKLHRDDKGTRYEIEPSEAEVVRYAFAEALAGSPLGSICRELNRHGFVTRPTRIRNTDEWRPGAVWRSSTVRRMLLSPYYAALLPEAQEAHYKPEAVDLDKARPGEWEAYVTVDELRAVRARLLNPARRKNGGNVARKWLLSGLAFCDTCGTPVRSARTREGFHGYRCVAGHFLRRGEVLDSYVEAVVLDRLSEPDAAALIAPRVDVDLPALRARDKALEGERAQLLKWFKERRFSASEIEAQQAEIDAERAEIGATISAALASDPVSDLLSDEDIRERWEGLSLARRRLVVSALLHVSIAPIGKGRRAETHEQAASTVALTWRRDSRERAAVGYPVPALSSGVEIDSWPLRKAAKEAVSTQLG